MATEQSPCPESKGSLVEENQFNKCVLTAEEKQKCVRLLHCSQNHSTGGTSHCDYNKGGFQLRSRKRSQKNPRSQYQTTTSHWNRNNAVSTAAYTLMRIKRWHLIDELLLFDPMKQNTNLLQLKAETILWPKFEETGEIDIPMNSVDAILNCELSQEQIEALVHLDKLMDEVDYNSSKPVDPSEAHWLTKLLNKSRNTTIVKKFLRKRFVVFTCSLCNALRLKSQDCGIVPEKLCEKIFMSFIDCILACVGEEQRFFVDKGIFGLDLDETLLDVELDGGQDIHLRVSSQPDVFIHETMTNFDKPAVLIGVVEAKGLMNQTIIDSDDEGIDEPKCRNPLHERLVLHTGQDFKDDEENKIVETDLEKLIKDAPPHLEGITELPCHARKGLKKFLPQLIGEMCFSSGTRNVRWFHSINGLKFGIGLVGFDVYFVTMMDSSSSYRNVFLTSPFNLLSKKDRRTVIKTLVAALYLDTNRIM